MINSDKEESWSLGLSLVLHCVILSWLSLIFVSNQDNRKTSPIIIEQINDTVTLEESIPDITNFSEIKTNIETDISDQIKESSLDTDQTIAQISVPEILSEQSDFFSEDTNNIPILDGVGDSVGTGVSSEKSVGGAIDRLTVEIMRNAEKKNLNTVWLLDASVSVSSQRDEIKNRFSKIIRELALSENAVHEINHVIASFGQSYSIISKEPTNDTEILVDDISSIVLDDSGIENVYSSVGSICKRFKSSDRTMIIVFTDEVGDDIQYLESVCSFCRQNNTVVYVVAPPSPFGQSKVEFKYIDPDPKFNQQERWVQIQQGPESLFKTTLDLKSLPVDNESIDSGFGSFGLSKLCNDTGGIYFSVHPNRSENKVSKREIAPLASNISVFFDSEKLLKYKPNYGSIKAQAHEASTFKIKSALIKACEIPVEIVGEQKKEFTSFNEGEFAEQINMAQRFSAKIEPKLNTIYSLLQPFENSTDNLKEYRWIASYHLALGRILATKCRIELYNIMLAEAKSGLKKQDTKNNCWTLENSDEVNSKNSQIDKTFQLAKKHLQYVVDNYPDTPWAYVAKQELNVPMGYKWIESYKEPPKPMEGGEGNNTPQDDERRMLEKKPMRKVDKI